MIASSLAFGIAALLHLPTSFSEAETLYAPPRLETEISASAWWDGQWRALPAYRADLRASHRQPLNVQYAGKLDVLSNLLAQRGWEHPPELTGASWLQWFGLDHPITKLPVLPQVHGGRHESLLLVKAVQGRNDEMWALRLWQSGITLEPKGIPLWVGNVTLLSLYAPVPGFAAPRVSDRFEEARSLLGQDLISLVEREVRVDGSSAHKLLLVRQSSERPTR